MLDENKQQDKKNERLSSGQILKKEIEEKIAKEPMLAALLEKKKKKRLKKSIWVTWLSKVMAGELSCLWELWFKTNFYNYRKIPESIELAKWQVNHSRMLYELRKERLAAGEKIFVENENRFAIEVKPGVFIEGQPDLIAISGDDVVIYDCKSGEQKASHQIQLMIYMYYVFHHLKKYPGLKPNGYLRYTQGVEVEVPDSLIDEKFIDDLNYFIGILGSDKEPMKAPSKFECKYCNITKQDCPERID